VLSKRDSRRCRQRRKLRRQLKRSARKQLATLKKLYNCSKRVNARPHKPTSLPQSVRHLVVLVQLVQKLLVLS
jgi:hypothetical protein